MVSRDQPWGPIRVPASTTALWSAMHNNLIPETAWLGDSNKYRQ